MTPRIFDASGSTTPKNAKRPADESSQKIFFTFFFFRCQNGVRNSKILGEIDSKVGVFCIRKFEFIKKHMIFFNVAC